MRFGRFFIISCILFVLLFASSASWAAKPMGPCPDSPITKIDFENTECKLDDKQIKIAIPFPGLQSKTYTPYEIHTTPTSSGGQEFCYYQESKKCYYTEGLSEYLAIFYSFAVGIMGILAVAMIVYGGYQYILARGNSSGIEKGKESIVGAVTGLVIALLSFVILYTINPSIVRVTDPQIPYVPPVEYNKTCPSDKEVVEIDYTQPGLAKGNMSEGDIGHRLMPNTLAGLYIAAKHADAEGYVIQVNSAFRSWEKQQSLYDSYQNGTGNPAAEPNCSSPHMSGQSVDVCMYKKNMSGSQAAQINLCGYGKTKNNGCSPLMEKLQLIMQNSGFTRYCGEWWHFEIPRMSASCTPGEYGTYPTSTTCSY